MNDIHAMAEALKGSDQNELLVPLGFAKDIEFECNSKKELEAQGLLMKKKEKPDWCFLQIEEVIGKKGKPIAPKKSFQISQDGKRISTKLLMMKKAQLTTMVKSIFIIHVPNDSMRANFTSLLISSF